MLDDELEHLTEQFVTDLERTGYEASKINGAMMAATRRLMERNIGMMGALVCMSSAVALMVKQLADAIADVDE